MKEKEIAVAIRAGIFAGPDSQKGRRVETGRRCGREKVYELGVTGVQVTVHMCVRLRCGAVCLFDALLWSTVPSAVGACMWCGGVCLGTVT